ncbi:hypothetical protein BKA70DRAFT_1433430 [Coprinopsis sp. MPI-PUGE-AT-0042]|nr:hypothetical protein BKA70DRAFT_1433430 [Coprinopsis sp. MPI-PUGE-AT-0042]
MLLAGCAFNSAWSLSWIFGSYVLCRLCLTVSGVSQLHAIFTTLDPSRARMGQGTSERGALTHLLAKMRVGHVMLLLWKTWGVTDVFAYPGMAQQLNNLSFFLMLAISCGPDPTMSLVLVAVLFALALGPSQSPEWNQMFLKIACALVIVAASDWLIAKKVWKSRHQVDEQGIREDLAPLWVKTDA